jgi:hypothetical protein
MTPENFKLLLEDLERRVARLEDAAVGPVMDNDPELPPSAFFDELDRKMAQSALRAMADSEPNPGLEMPNVGTADRQVMAIHKRGDYLGSIMPNATVTLDGDYSVEDLLAIATLMARASGKSGVFRNED